MIEIIDAIQWQKSAEIEVPVGPEHGKPRSPIGRQRCRLASQAIERLRGESRLRDQSDVDVAVAQAESPMGKATHKIGSEQFRPERRLPNWNCKIGKIDRSCLGRRVRCLIHMSRRPPRHQSSFAPENLTTLPHFSVSSAMSLPKSVGKPGSTVPPKSAN